MCGIGSIWFREGVNPNILFQMIKATEKRGHDAFGIVRIRPCRGQAAGTTAIKSFDDFSSLSLTPDALVKALDVRLGDIVIWNCRARPMTEQAAVDTESVQPLVYPEEGLILSHNGVVANEETDKPRRTTIDSEVFLHRYVDLRNPRIAVEQMVGGSAYILYDNTRNKLTVIRDYQPLAKAYLKGVGYMVMSDVDEFEEILGPMDVAVWEYHYYSDLTPFTINEIDLDSGLINVIPFKPNYVHSLPPQSQTKAVVLASGGVDSSMAAVIASLYLNQQVTLVHFATGHKSDGGETKAVKYLADFLQCELKIIDMQWLGQLGNSVLTDPSLAIPLGESRLNLKSTVCWTPARNMVMLSALVAIAEGTGAAFIYNGFTLEESGSYPDNSQDFFKSFNRLSNFGTLMRPQVRMLLSNLMKPEIVAIANWYGVDLSKLWSCDTTPEDGEECGVCGACTLKQMAIEQSTGINSSAAPLLLRKVTP